MNVISRVVRCSGSRSIKRTKGKMKLGKQRTKEARQVDKLEQGNTDPNYVDWPYFVLTIPTLQNINYNQNDELHHLKRINVIRRQNTSESSMMFTNDHPPHTSVSKELLWRNHGSTKDTKAKVFTLVKNIEHQEMIKSIPRKAVLSPWQQNNICVAVAILCHSYIWNPMHTCMHISAKRC